MNLLTMAKLGITVISGLILSVGSVGNYTTSPNTAEENLEAKGCAANFECPLGTVPFHYPLTNFEQENVEDVDKWVPGYNPDSDCGGFVKACVICVSPDFTEGTGPSMTLKSNLIIEAEETATDIARVLGSQNDSAFDFSNRN